VARRETLVAVAATLGAFHLTGRAMRTAQERIEAALAAGDVDERGVRAYLDAVRRYFGPYEREANGQLRSPARPPLTRRIRYP